MRALESEGTCALTIRPHAIDNNTTPMASDRMPRILAQVPGASKTVSQGEIREKNSREVVSQGGKEEGRKTLMKDPPILPSSLLKICRCGGSLLYGVARLNPTRNATPRRLPAPKCVPLNGFPKLNAYVWSATLFIQNDSAASARGPRAIVQVVTKSTTARGLTRPVSKSTVSDPGRPLRSSRASSSSLSTPTGVPDW